MSDHEEVVRLATAYMRGALSQGKGVGDAPDARTETRAGGVSRESVGGGMETSNGQANAERNGTEPTLRQGALGEP
jgi:hypothetical protein